MLSIYYHYYYYYYTKKYEEPIQVSAQSDL